MTKKLKNIPHFTSENEEREFWATHDMTDYADLSTMIVNPAMPNLKPSTKTISLRLPIGMLSDIRKLANQRDVPYQSFIKMILADRLEQEQRK